MSEGQRGNTPQKLNRDGTPNARPYAVRKRREQSKPKGSTPERGFPHSWGNVRRTKGEHPTETQPRGYAKCPPVRRAKGEQASEAQRIDTRAGYARAGRGFPHSWGKCPKDKGGTLQKPNRDGTPPPNPGHPARIGLAGGSPWKSGKTNDASTTFMMTHEIAFAGGWDS